MNIFEAGGTFTSEQVVELDALARDWAFLTGTQIADASYEIARAYWASGPRDRYRRRTVERMGFNPFEGTPEELIEGLRERIGGAAPSWWGSPLPTSGLVEVLGAPLVPLVNWLSKKLTRKSL